ncbi:MAG TPA: hypothetical protein VF809_03385 [Candidatus Saccharimonadales bacterium]
MGLDRKQIDRLVAKQLADITKSQLASNTAGFEIPDAKKLTSLLLKSDGKPYIAMLYTYGSAVVGEHFELTFYLSNPSSIAYESDLYCDDKLYLTLFFGPAHFINDPAQAIMGRDSRLPYITTGPIKLEAYESSVISVGCTLPDEDSCKPYIDDRSGNRLRKSTLISNAMLWGVNEANSTPSQISTVYCRTTTSAPLYAESV